MTKEAFIKGESIIKKPVEINKGLIVERNTKRITNLSKNEKIYAQGDGLMKIAPFDNYYLFTIYSELNLEDIPVDIHNMGSFFLTFKDKESEVRIENYKNTKDIDPTNGQILFRISQEDAEKILSMDTKVFYLTSMLYDDRSKSDETVLYSGKFAEYNDANTSFLTDEISNLNKELENVKKEKLENETSLQKKVDELSDTLVKLRSEYSSLQDNLKVYKDAYTELSKGMQDYQSEVEKRINKLEIEAVDAKLREQKLLEEAKKYEKDKIKLNTAIKALAKPITGIKLATPVYDNRIEKSSSEASETIKLTVQEEKLKIANIAVKTGIVNIYEFMYTKKADLDTQIENDAYDNISYLYDILKKSIDENKYNNIYCYIVYSENDHGNLMKKYNVNSNCILVVKDDAILDKFDVNLQDYIIVNIPFMKSKDVQILEKSATILAGVERIIKENNN